MEQEPLTDGTSGHIRRRGAVVAVAVAVAVVATAVVAIGGALGDEDANSAGDHPGVALQAPIEQPEGSARILQRCSHAFDDRDEELAAEPRIFGRMLR